MVNDVYGTPRDGEETPGQARARKKARANMTDPTPTTEAGRMLLSAHDELFGNDVRLDVNARIIAIEAEARGDVERLRGMTDFWPNDGDHRWTEPTTEAGRDLDRWMYEGGAFESREGFCKRILAIEAEARAGLDVEHAHREEGDPLLDEMSERWVSVERTIWPDGPAHGHGSGAYAGLKAEIIARLRKATMTLYTDTPTTDTPTTALVLDEWRLARALPYYRPRNEATCIEDARTILANLGEGICGAVSNSGPNGEPLACAYPPILPGELMHAHSWATLPTFVAEN
jgi:hypothetical protein